MFGQIAKLFGGDSVGKVVKEALSVIDELHLSDEEKAKLKEKGLERADKQATAEAERLAKSDERQVEQSKQDSKHTSVFVSGWRPYCGWSLMTLFNLIAVISLVLALYITLHILYGDEATVRNGERAMASFVAYTEVLLGTIVTLLAGMLGLASLRTWEKTKGVASK